MYRPSLYSKHDETMNNFAELFNNCSTCSNLRMEPITEETFIDDGEFIDINTGKRFSFDWEYRDKYFSNGNFAFDTLGQYERKIVKPSIQLSIQCDSTETAIVVAWHEDFKKENKQKLNLSTDYSEKQFGAVRYTHAFKVYMYTDIDEFKRMIQRAFDTVLNSSVF